MPSAEKVFHYFKELSKIPRSSGDEKAVADRLVRFAEERHLECVRDERNNVIIRKAATKAGCQCAPVILQGHTDMVYVRTPECTRRYEDGIGLIEKDGFLGIRLSKDEAAAANDLLKGFELHLKELSELYPNYIKIERGAE